MHARDPNDAAEVGRSPGAESGELCTRFAAIQCEGEQLCCSRSSRSRDGCQRELAQICTGSLHLDAIAAHPESGFDARVADRMFTELARRTARCDPAVLRSISTVEGLRGIFRGTRGGGESCNPPGGVTGDPAQVAAALTVCKVDDALACLPNGLLGDFRCVPKQAPGQPCLTDDNCLSEDVCDNFSQPRLGTCVARQPLEARCDDPGRCETLRCEDGVCTQADAELVFCPSLG